MGGPASRRDWATLSQLTQLLPGRTFNHSKDWMQSVQVGASQHTLAKVKVRVKVMKVLAPRASLPPEGWAQLGGPGYWVDHCVSWDKRHIWDTEFKGALSLKVAQCRVGLDLGAFRGKCLACATLVSKNHGLAGKKTGPWFLPAHLEASRRQL